MDKNHPADFLNRKDFLELLNNIVDLSFKESTNQIAFNNFTSIGIDGEWGSGKSWILQEFMQQHKNDYLIFYYNAWSNDYYKEPLVAILSAIVNTINSSNNIELLKSKINNAAIKELKDVALKIISNIEFKGVKLGNIIDIFRRLRKKTEIEFTNNLKFIDNAIEEISKVLSKIQIPMILIVDELDRCLPEYAIKTMERLHHLNTKSNITQIIAINKKSMEYGIAKVYGRFDLLNSSDTTNISHFSFNYLKKFFSIFLPLNNGFIDDKNSLILFGDDFINKVSDFKQQNPLSSIKINIDSNFFSFFYSQLFKNINFRDQMRIVELVRTCHIITSNSNEKLDCYEYQHLIWEILICVDLYLTKDNILKDGFKSKNCSQSNVESFYLGDSTANLNKHDNSYIDFAKNLENLFKNNSEIKGNNGLLRITLENFNLQIYDNYTFILAYYCIFIPHNIIKDVNGIIYEKLINKILNEQKFLKLFRKNLLMLIASNH